MPGYSWKSLVIPRNWKFFKRQSIDTNSENTQMLELSDQNFKAIIIKKTSASMKTHLKQIKNLKSSEKIASANRWYKEEPN